ncbi:RNA polymerase sigma factor [Arabiibacter massiliensis]|uniref:RNA polymerase sigma factor n=1 Tax=Arabiibacter massiliensis TaxID=1870985 RepID=UPI0009B97808|nr:sigma-70 family RNA polymerase sigma factor [Arabiibacter massiliensis]
MRKAPLADVAAAIDSCGNAVLHLALCRTGSRADAEDVFQNVFLRLHQSAPKLESEEHLRAWLLRVTVNCCNDWHREARKHPRTAFDEAIAVEGRGGLPDDEADELRRAVAQLPARQQTALHLFYFEGYSTEEVARITGERPATVRSHLHRARKTLKIMLEGGRDA